MRSRTMIYLDLDQIQSIREEAKALGISLAELMRRLVRDHLESRQIPRISSREDYLKIVALGSSGREGALDLGSSPPRS